MVLLALKIAVLQVEESIMYLKGTGIVGLRRDETSVSKFVLERYNNKAKEVCVGNNIANLRLKYS